MAFLRGFLATLLALRCVSQAPSESEAVCSNSPGSSQPCRAFEEVHSQSLGKRRQELPHERATQKRRQSRTVKLPSHSAPEPPATSPGGSSAAAPADKADAGDAPGCNSDFSSTPNLLPGEVWPPPVDDAALSDSASFTRAPYCNSPSAAPLYIALLVLWIGPLPNYVQSFVASLASARRHPLEVLILHTDVRSDFQSSVEAVNAGNVRFVHLTIEDLARRVLLALRMPENASREEDIDELVEKLTPEKAGAGDLKPLYGAMFKEELKQYSHWGWTDLDIIFGDLAPIVRDVPLYDIVTYPDGAIHALYLSGQLTIFRNTEYFRKFFLPRIWIKDDGGKQTKEVWLAALMLENGNHLWDEQFAIWLAVRDPRVRLLVDFSRQAGSVCYQDRELSVVVLHADGGLLLNGTKHGKLPHGRAEPASVRHWQAEVDSYKEQKFHYCVAFFRRGFSWHCVPRHTDGVTYVWSDGRLVVSSIDDTRGHCTGREVAFLHLHWMKLAASLEITEGLGTYARGEVTWLLNVSEAFLLYGFDPVLRLKPAPENLQLPEVSAQKVIDSLGQAYLLPEEVPIGKATIISRPGKQDRPQQQQVERNDDTSPVEPLLLAKVDLPLLLAFALGMLAMTGVVLYTRSGSRE